MRQLSWLAVNPKQRQIGRYLRRLLGKVRGRSLKERVVEARVETLMENLAVALMQANNLAADSPKYEALAETLAYALDLVEVGLLSESNAVFNPWEPPKAH